jgi:hypothetical protein
MTLFLSKFQKDAPNETREEIGEVDFALDATKHCYYAEFDGIDIPGETPMRICISCTDPQAYLSMTVFQDGSNVINMVAALKNYAHAMVQFRSGYYLDIHVERDRLRKADA